MRCPHCGENLSSIICPLCKEEIPERSKFCCWCGKPIERVEEQIDLYERIPCSDGTCIGTINEMGICNICKKPYKEKD